MNNRYISLDISDLGIDLTDQYGYFVSGDTLDAEGFTLSEVFDSAVVYLVDQDGGEIGEVNPWDMNCFKDLEDLLIKEYNRLQNIEATKIKRRTKRISSIFTK